MFVMCLALYHTNAYKSVAGMPVWGERRRPCPASLGEVGGQPAMAASTAEDKLAETMSKAKDAFHMASLILGQKYSQRRGRIILEVGSPLRTAFSRELTGCLPEEITRQFFISFSKSVYSYVLRRFFHICASSAALVRMFCFCCADKDYYTSQLRQASSASPSDVNLRCPLGRREGQVHVGNRSGYRAVAVHPHDGLAAPWLPLGFGARRIRQRRQHSHLGG